VSLHQSFFLDLGADINSADACFMEPPVGVGQFAGYFTYESALSEFIKVLYSTTDEGRFYTPRSGFYERLRYLVAFLETLPDLNAHTCCLMQSTHSPYYTINDWNLGLPLSALSEDNINNKLECSDNDQYAIIITEANLKYLVQYFLETLSSHDSATTALITRALQLVQGESSKSYFKACFIVTLQLGAGVSRTHSATCYRFMNEDVNVFSDLDRFQCLFADAAYESVPTFQMSWEKAHEYIEGCEKVDVSALSVLLDQRLGVCFRES
jgi:hypothetical protein